MFKYVPVINFFVLFALLLQGQSFTPRTFPVIGHQGQLLENPFSGGLDTPQFSEADVNNDGLQDIYIFDFSGKVSEVYLNGGDKWIYASEYAKAFPGLSYTALLRDYNGDGAADLFAHSGDTGVDGYIVYQGYYDNDTLRFQQLFLEYAEPYLKYEDEVGTEQILLIESDVYPSISDLDGDGDLDFISIKTSGGYFEMYRNTSIENGWGLDSLTFMKDVECFGGVREEGGQSLMLASTSNLCAPLRSVADSENIHGGYSFLSFDNDGDGNKDLLFGDRSYPSMNMLWNGNNDNSPHFTSQDTFFPSDNIPVNVSIGPVSFLIDGDFDGMKDIVVSSRSCPLDKDSYTLFYKNMGTNISPIFEQTEEDWLGNTMMDYGKFNHPTFTDYNQDGLMDLVVATQVIRLSPNYFGSNLLLFENVGTYNSPSFHLVDDDWLNLSNLDSYWLSPSFGDLDGDGDQDLLLGDRDAELVYLENIAGTGVPYSFNSPILGYMGIGVDFSLSTLASPQIVDLDQDDLMDIVVGVRQGNIIFFKNIGTNESPDFNADPNAFMNDFQLGNIFFGPASTPVPRFVIEDEEQVLYVGVADGNIMKIKDITSNIYTDFTITDDNWKGINVGEFASPTFVDIDRNGYNDIFIGNFRGGMNTWATSNYIGDAITSNNELTNNENSLTLFPNPVKDELSFQSEENIISIIIYNIEGRRMNSSLRNISQLPKGMYFLEIQTKENIYIEKIIKE